MNFIILFLGIWAIAWINYSWKQPPKNFIIAGLLTGFIPLMYLSVLGITIIGLTTTISLSHVSQTLNITIPPLAWKWFGYSISSLVFFHVGLFIYFQNKIYKYLKNMVGKNG